MKLISKRILSLFLTVAMIIGMIPSVFAADNDDTGVAESNVSQETTDSTGNSLKSVYVDSEGNELLESVAEAGEDEAYREIADYTFDHYDRTITYIYKANEEAEQHAWYIQGYEDSTVRPEASMTRAEAVQALYRLFGNYFDAYSQAVYDGDFSEVETDAAGFNDVSSDAWYYEPVIMMQSLGLISADGDGNFRPDEAMTRYWFAELISFVAQLDYENSDEQVFSDVTSDYEGANYINAAANANWINGYEDGTFRPDDTMTRAETLKLLNSAMGRDDITIPDSFTNPYTDIDASHWAYADMMEASSSHDSGWHENSSDGAESELNLVTNMWVDEDGNFIQDTESEAGEDITVNAPEIEGYVCIGTQTTTTWHYSNSSTVVPNVTKTSSVDTIEVGDSFTYTMEIGNNGDEDSVWLDVVATDKIPTGLTVTDVQIDGVSDDAEEAAKPYSEYDEETNIVTIYCGDIAYGESITVTITAQVTEDAVIGETLINTVTAVGENGIATDDGTNKGTGKNIEGEGSDDGVTPVDSSKGVVPEVTKAADVSSGTIGGTVVYTITAANTGDEDSVWTNVIGTDEIPASMTFNNAWFGDEASDSDTDSSETPYYEYDNETGILTIYYGNIAYDETVTLSVECTINKTAVTGDIIKNTVVIEGEDEDGNPVTGEATDEGITVEELADCRPSIEKTADVETVKAGEEFNYIITASNAEDAEEIWYSAVGTDVLPSAVSYVSFSSDNEVATVENDNGSLTINFGDIAAGESVTVTITVKANMTGILKTTVTNTVTADGLNIPEDEDKPSDSVDVIITSEPGPYMTKAINIGTQDVDGEHTAEVGDTFTYTIVAGNEGTRSWDNVTLTDTLPDQLTFVSYETNDWISKTINGQTITMNFGDIAVGEYKTVTITVEVNDTAEIGDFVRNTVIASPGAADGSDYEASDDGVRIYGDPNPSVTKTATGLETIDGEVTAEIGDEFTYVITASNNGDYRRTWTGATGTDELPTSLEYVSFKSSDGSTASADGQNITINFGDIACNETKSIEITVRVTDSATVGELIKNTVIVSGGSDGLNDGPFTSDATDKTVRVYGNPNPSVTKSTSATYVAVGDTYEYTITASNLGEYLRTWRDVIGTDVLDDGLTYVSSSSDDGVTASASGQTVTIDFGNIACGETKSITIKVEVNKNVKPASTITNTVKLTGGSSGSSTDDFTAEDTDKSVTSYGDPNLEVSKTTNYTDVSIGSTAEYTISASNNGTYIHTAKNVVGTDELPDGLAYVSCSSNDGVTVNSNGSTLTINFGDIAMNQTKSVVIKVQVTSSASVGTALTNTVTVTGENPSENGETPTDEDSDSNIVPYNATPSPKVTKTVDKTTADAGYDDDGNLKSVVTYTILVENQATDSKGNASADWTNVVLTDELSQYMTPIDNTVTLNGNTVDNALIYNNGTFKLSVTIGTLKAGESATVTFQITPSGVSQGSYIENTAVGTGDNGTAEGTADKVYVNISPDPVINEYSALMLGLQTYDAAGTTLVSTDFKPDTALTRAQAAQIFFRMFGYDAYTSSGSAVSTYYNDTWTGATGLPLYYEEAVSFLVDKSALSGSSDGTFRGDDAITVAEFATIFAKLAGCTETFTQADCDTYGVTYGQWYSDYVCYAAKWGLISTDSTGKVASNNVNTDVMLRKDVAVNLSSNNLYPGRMLLFYDYMNQNNWDYNIFNGIYNDRSTAIDTLSDAYQDAIWSSGIGFQFYTISVSGTTVTGYNLHYGEWGKIYDYNG